MQIQFKKKRAPAKLQSVPQPLPIIGNHKPCKSDQQECRSLEETLMVVELQAIKL